jgi:DNA-binding response OmpR family regulator
MARVLLVDDHAEALSLRKLIFEADGHQVAVASTANLAREQFHAEAPDSVILDLRLPDAEDGLALIREFRDASRNVKIVVLSGCCADLEQRIEGRMVDLVLSKPARSEVLRQAVQGSGVPPHEG